MRESETNVKRKNEEKRKEQLVKLGRREKKIGKNEGEERNQSVWRKGRSNQCILQTKQIEYKVLE